MVIDRKTNKEVFEYTRESRPFLAIAKQEATIIKSMINRRINEMIKKHFG